MERPASGTDECSEIREFGFGQDKAGHDVAILVRPVVFRSRAAPRHTAANSSTERKSPPA
jgi:hypothetical protein